MHRQRDVVTSLPVSHPGSFVRRASLRRFSVHTEEPARKPSVCETPSSEKAELDPGVFADTTNPLLWPNLKAQLAKVIRRKLVTSGVPRHVARQSFVDL